jgi:hypothetical protein
LEESQLEGPFVTKSRVAKVSSMLFSPASQYGDILSSPRVALTIFRPRIKAR